MATDIFADFTSTALGAFLRHNGVIEDKYVTAMKEAAKLIDKAIDKLCWDETSSYEEDENIVKERGVDIGQCHGFDDGFDESWYDFGWYDLGNVRRRLGSIRDALEEAKEPRSARQVKIDNIRPRS